MTNIYKSKYDIDMIFFVAEELEELVDEEMEIILWNVSDVCGIRPLF